MHHTACKTWLSLDIRWGVVLPSHPPQACILRLQCFMNGVLRTIKALSEIAIFYCSVKCLACWGLFGEHFNGLRGLPALTRKLFVHRVPGPYNQRQGIWFSGKCTYTRLQEINGVECLCSLSHSGDLSVSPCPSHFSNSSFYFCSVTEKEFFPESNF